MSVCRDGKDVSVRPRTTPASMSVHGAWQIAPTGLPCSKKSWTKLTAFSSWRRLSGLPTPPRQDEPVVVRRVRLFDRLVDFEGAGLVVVLEALHLAVFERDELKL